MNAADIVMRFMTAGEQGDWETFAECVADDYVFLVPPIRQTKRELISSQKALWGAFPDFKFNLRITEVRENTVKGVYQLSGTHTGTLIPPVPGSFMAIQPTGKRIVLAENDVEYTLRDGKIIQQKVGANPDSGWMGILKQLGVKDPYAGFQS